MHAMSPSMGTSPPKATPVVPQQKNDVIFGSSQPNTIALDSLSRFGLSLIIGSSLHPSPTRPQWRPVNFRAICFEIDIGTATSVMDAPENFCWHPKGPCGRRAALSPPHHQRRRATPQSHLSSSRRRRAQKQ